MLLSIDRLRPFTLLRTLGRGVFGEVWLAERRCSLLTTQVALILPLAAEKEIETVHQKRTHWLRASGHPSVVPVLHAGV